jgi:hypothetical protein
MFIKYSVRSANGTIWFLSSLLIGRWNLNIWSIVQPEKEVDSNSSGSTVKILLGYTEFLYLHFFADPNDEGLEVHSFARSMVVVTRPLKST